MVHPHTPAHKNTQSTLPVCWHINWSAPHSINCKVSYPAHTRTHMHLCTILALISSLCKAGDHQISPQNLHDNKNQLSQHRVESAHIPSLDTEWMQMEMQISGFKVPAGLRWRRSASDWGARLPLGGSSRSCVQAEKWGVLVEEVVQGKISEELTVQRWDEMGPSSAIFLNMKCWCFFSFFLCVCVCVLCVCVVVGCGRKTWNQTLSSACYKRKTGERSWRACCKYFMDPLCKTQSKLERLF